MQLNILEWNLIFNVFCKESTTWRILATKHRKISVTVVCYKTKSSFLCPGFQILQPIYYSYFFFQFEHASILVKYKSRISWNWDYVLFGHWELHKTSMEVFLIFNFFLKLATISVTVSLLYVKFISFTQVFNIDFSWH